MGKLRRANSLPPSSSNCICIIPEMFDGIKNSNTSLSDFIPELTSDLLKISLFSWKIFTLYGTLIGLSFKKTSKIS